MFLRGIDGFKAPVEIVERFQFTKAGCLYASFDESLLAYKQFVLEDQLQKFGMIQLMTGGLLHTYIEAFGQAGKTQLFEQRQQTFIHGKTPCQRR